MRTVELRAVVALALLASSAGMTAQTPQPFPRGGQPPQTSPPPAPRAASQAPPSPASRPAVPPPGAPPPASPAEPVAPTEAQLGFPIYPAAQFITSYDAGRGQRYYLFGTTASFADMVTYYRTSLKEKGNLVFEQPPTHVFEVGRFREETMAFPPGVTVKDYSWGGSTGYPNPKRGGQPERFVTIVQIVPPPAAASAPKR